MIYNEKKHYLKDQTLKVDRLENAFSSSFSIIQAENMQVPISASEKHCKYFTTGCIYNKSGEKQILSERLGGFSGDFTSLNNTASSPSPSRLLSKKLKGNTFYLGVWMGHYGHFITETLSRLWMYKDIKHYDNLVSFPFIFDHSKPVKDYQAYLLHLLDIPSDNILTLRKPMRFEQITIPEQGWTINRSVNKNIKPLYEHIRDKHSFVTQTYEKIFLSRNDAAYQRINNVVDIEAVFKKRGFTILYPDKLSIQEQLSIYANCKIMAGFSGSALHNCLFTYEDTLIIELADTRTRNRLHPMQHSALELSGNNWQLINYQGDEDKNFDLEYLEDKLSINN